MSDYLSSIASTINQKYTSNMGLFQIGGAVSGLDTSTIIDEILKAESQPLNQLTERFKKLDLMKKAYNEVKQKLEEFRDFVFDFKLQKNVMLKTAESSNENVLQAQAFAGATDGTYFVKVLQMATNSTLYGRSTVRVDIDPSSTKFGDLNYYTTPTNSTIRIYNSQTGEYKDVDITTDNTIDDIVNNIKSAIDDLFGSGSADVSFSNGKLSIGTNDDSKQITITQLSGNFMQVFHLDEDSPTGAATDKIESTAPVWAIRSSLKTLQDLANYNGTSVSDGTIKINGVDIKISTSDTIDEILDKINSSKAGVFAYYDYHQNKVVLRRNDFGNKAITLEDDGNILSTLGLVDSDYSDSDNPVFVAGQNAHLQISMNGVDYVDVYSDKNEGIDFEGISFTVRATSTTPVMVKVNTDKEAIKKKLHDFVDKWNDLMGYIYEKLNEEPVKNKNPEDMTDEEKMKGVLRNDQYLRSIFDRLKRFMTMEVSSDEKFKYLFEIGISSGDVGGSYENMMKGKLTVDDDKLDKVIDNNLEDLWKFLGDGDNSFMQKLHNFLWNLTKFNGEIDSVAGTDGRIYREQRMLSKEIADWMERLQEREQELWRKFDYMEQVISKFQSMGAWLAQATAKRK